MSGADRDRKTEKPTPKRVLEFRKRGEIARSKDITTTATLMGGLITAIAFIDVTSGAMERLMREALGTSGQAGVGIAGVALSAFLAAIAPTIVGAMGAYLIASSVQLGWPPVIKPPKFNIGKVFTLSSIKNILSPQAMAGRALSSTAKVCVVFCAGVLALRSVFSAFESSSSMGVAALSDRILMLLLRLTVYSGGALSVIAAIDYWWNWRTLTGKMRMTKDEVKREHKDQEGDPVVSGRRRQRQRDLAKRRVTTAVKTADVVIVNPTHYAVALRYRADESGAPVVLAKGRDALAEVIRQTARSAGIPVLTRPPLTRMIHKVVPEGQEIPAQLFAAVAEVLAYVYRIRGGAPQQAEATR